MAIKIILLLVSCMLIGLILMQGGRTEGLSSAITGSDKLSLFATAKSRGTDKFFDRATLLFAVLFLGIITILKFF